MRTLQTSGLVVVTKKLRADQMWIRHAFKIGYRAACLLLGFVLITYLALNLMNKTILRSNSSAALRLTVQIVAPPRDLYEPLATASIDLHTVGAKSRIEFSNKYSGAHEFGILLPSASGLASFDTPIPDVKLGIECFEQGRSVLSRIISGGSPFAGKYGNGISLASYSCPEDLPIEQPLLCEISVKEALRTSGESFKNAILFARKRSDM